MVTNIEDFNVAMRNRDFTSIRIGTKGLDSTSDDMLEITELSSVTCSWNADTEESDLYSNAAKGTDKNPGAPSVEGTFEYAGTACHKYLISTGRLHGKEALTQVEVDTIDDKTISYVACVIVENFAADGAASDKASYKFQLPYARYDIVITDKVTGTVEETS